jgi:hypothetical protein
MQHSEQSKTVTLMINFFNSSFSYSTRYLFEDPEFSERRQMIWEKGLLSLMKRLKEGPEALDTSSNKYKATFC